MHEGEGSHTFKLLPQGAEDSSYMWIYQVIPGIRAAFYEYNSPYCHIFNDMTIVRDIIGNVEKPRKMLEINMCREGAFRLVSSKRQSFISLLQGDLALTITEISDWARTLPGNFEESWILDLPTNQYRGFGLIIDLVLVEAHSKEILASLGIEIAGILESYSLDEKIFIMAADLGLEKAIDSIEFHRKNDSTPLFRLSVLELLARIGARSAPPKSLARPECSLEVLHLTKEARNHAVKYLCERHTIGALSRKFGMSPTVFKSAFREVYREPYARYMTRIRMEQAETLLAKEGLVQSVAEAVGYKSPSKFAAAFRRVFNESPTTYRNRMRKANGESADSPKGIDDEKQN